MLCQRSALAWDRGSRNCAGFAQLCALASRVRVGRLLRFFEAGSPFVSGPRKEIRRQQACLD